MPLQLLVSEIPRLAGWDATVRLAAAADHSKAEEEATKVAAAAAEAANLVTTFRHGREKLHYLNPVPIHQIGERWIKKFERGKLAALSELKRQLEQRDE